MSKKPTTHVAIVLDRSGSMGSIRKQALENYNEQIQQMKENAKDQDIFCSLVTFNGEVYEHLWDKPAAELEEADENAYVPSGGTAMYDALGYTIKKLKETTTDDGNTAYLIVVISDGAENASKYFGVPYSLNEADLKLFSKTGRSDLKVLIEDCQTTSKWTFSYMGCDESYLRQVAAQTGIPISNMAAFSTQDSHSASLGFARSRQRCNSYYEGRTKGFTSSNMLYSDNAMCAADFTQEGSPQPTIEPQLDLSVFGQTMTGVVPNQLPDSIQPVVIQGLPDIQSYNQDALASMRRYDSIPVIQKPFGGSSEKPNMYYDIGKRSRTFEGGNAVSWKQ